ncbi:MAG: class I SAM-dependent methyltransferase [Kiloniellales bacterium]
MSGNLESWLAANRANWDERAAIHRRDSSGFYQVARFLAGEETLNAIEARELPELRGKRVVHLQCHFGLDSLNLVRRGAQVTGLDFSPVAVSAARSLAAEAGLSADFVQGDLYKAPELIAGQADLVYVTWGAINWLPDIAGWARVVAALLKPGGQLYLAEAHPNSMAMEEVEGRLTPTWDLPTPPDKPLTTEEPNTYNGDPTLLENVRNYEWLHSLSQVLAALQAAGMRLDWLHEHPVVVWQQFPSLVSEDGCHFRLPDHWPQMPLSYSLSATKGA